MAEVAPTSSENETSALLEAMIASLKVKDTECRLKVMSDQGEYSHILQYTLHTDGDDALWAHFAVKHSTSLMDVLLRFRGEAFVSEALRVSFNKAAEHRIKEELASAITAADEWWSNVGGEIYRLDNARAKRTTPRTKKPKAHNGGKASKKARAPVDVDDAAPTPHGMKTAQDVINRIVWDKSLPAEHFTVGYIDRFVGVVEKSFNTFNWSAFNQVDPEATAIPRHRIVYIKYLTAKVWDRENRIDHVFGSVGGDKLRPIDDIIEEENDKDGTIITMAVGDSELEDDHLVPCSSSSLLPQHHVPCGSSVADVMSLTSRPTHYLCLRITDTSIVDRLQAMQTAIRQSFAGHVDRYQPDTNFHVTLTLFCEEGNDDLVDRIGQTIARARDDIAAVLDSAVLNIEGIALLKQYRVIVATLTRSTAMEKLLALVNAYLQEDAVPAYMYPASGLHLTLCKLKSVRDISQWTEMSSWCSLQALSERESNARLSLQKVGPANIGIELLPESVTTTTSEFVDTPELFGVHVRNAHEYDSWSSVVYRAASVGAKALAFFLVDKTSTNIVEMPDAREIREFHTASLKCSIHVKSMVPHGPYALVLGGDTSHMAGEAFVQRMAESRACIVNHVLWCSGMGIPMYNIHAYTHGVKISSDPTLRSAFLAMVAENLNAVLRETSASGVTILLETGCGGIGEPTGTFEELRAIIELVDDQARIGVCFDTCHAFAAGYDLRAEEDCRTTFADFDRVIGLPYLKAFHLNDSRTPLSAGVDRHAHIGEGCIGEACFEYILEHFAHVPMVLETPDHALDQQLGDMTKLTAIARRLALRTNRDGDVMKAVASDTKTTTSKIGVKELDAQLTKIFEKVRERRADVSIKEMCRQRLEAFLVKHWPTDVSSTVLRGIVCSVMQNVRMVLIGGSGMGVGCKGSDTDLALLMGNGTLKYAGDWHHKLQSLERVARLITKDAAFRDLLDVVSVEVRTGFVPVLRLNTVSYMGGNHVDISCNDMSAVRDAHLVRAYVSIDERVAPLCVHLKRWARGHGVDRAAKGYPNAYSYILMVVLYLQERDVLPCLQSQHPQHFNDTTDVSVLATHDFPAVIYASHTKSTNTVARLFLDMVTYYGEVSFAQHFMSVRRGAVLDRAAINAEENSDAATAGEMALYIEDPFERRNTARCVVDKEIVARLAALFEKSTNDIKSAIPAVK